MTEDSDKRGEAPTWMGVPTRYFPPFLHALHTRFYRFKQRLRTAVYRPLDRLGLVYPDDIYSAEYYRQRREEPHWSDAENVATALRDVFSPSSVIDYGCAIGAYLYWLQQLGVERVYGVEGAEAAIEESVIPDDAIEQHDLRQPYDPGETFDLALSIEVAEHIHEDYADTFVDTLAKSGRWVVLTAAPPGQPGVHHVNEQPRDYWIDKFEQRGASHREDKEAELRSRVSVSQEYLAENLMVFRMDG